MTGKKLIGHWTFSICHFSFFIFKSPGVQGDARTTLKMTNEKWKMTNDQ